MGSQPVFLVKKTVFLDYLLNKFSLDTQSKPIIELKSKKLL